MAEEGAGGRKCFQREFYKRSEAPSVSAGGREGWLIVAGQGSVQMRVNLLQKK